MTTQAVRPAGAEASTAALAKALESVRAAAERVRPGVFATGDTRADADANNDADTNADADADRWRDAAVLEALNRALVEARLDDGSGSVDALARSYDTVLAHRPTVTASGSVVLKRTDGAERRFRGSYATPGRLADAVAARALPGPMPGPMPRSGPMPGAGAGAGPGEGAQARHVLDPACGTGSLLRAALRRLIALGVPAVDAVRRLHGVELDPVAAAVCRAALLSDLRQQGVHGAALDRATDRLEHQILVGEALLGPAAPFAGTAAPAEQGGPAAGIVWHEAFPAVLAEPTAPVDPVTGWSGGFDVVLANPPWERLKVSRRDWAGTPPSGLRDERAQLAAALRERGRHPLTGRGELNAYLLFVETCWRLLAAAGRSCVVVPAGFVTDRSAAPLLSHLVRRGALDRLHVLGPDVAAFAGVSARVGVALVDLAGGPGGPGEGRPGGRAPARIAVDVSWQQVESASFPQEWSLDSATLELVSPNTGSPPPCASPRDAALTVSAHRRWEVLVRRAGPGRDGGGPGASGERPGGEPRGPWQVRLVTPLHMTRDVRWFERQPAEGLLPVWEAKLAGLLDPRGGSAEVRYWVPAALVRQRFGGLLDRGWLAGYRNVTTVDSARTLLPTPLPPVGVGNSLPLIDAPRLPLLLACLASLPLDYLARQKHAGPNLNFFKLEQLPVPDPSVYDDPAPWDRSISAESWVLARFADAVPRDAAGLQALRDELDGAGRGAGLSRADALAELDAAHAVLLGWGRPELEHAIGTFTALRFRDERLNDGRFVTRERILTAFERLAN